MTNVAVRAPRFSMIAGGFNNAMMLFRKIVISITDPDVHKETNRKSMHHTSKSEVAPNRCKPTIGINGMVE